MHWRGMEFAFTLAEESSDQSSTDKVQRKRGPMEYQELITAAESNLKAKTILKNYSVDEGIHFRKGRK